MTGVLARPTRRVAWVSLSAVALIAGIASYLHALVVVQAADGHRWVSELIPLLADLVIASSAANILDATHSGHARPRWSMLSVAVGVIVTVAANWASGFPHSVPVWCVNVWPPVAFVFAAESIVGIARRSRADAEAAEIVASAGQGQTGRTVSTEDALRALLTTDSVRGLAAHLGVPKSRVETWRTMTRPPSERVPVAGLNGSAPDAV